VENGKPVRDRSSGDNAASSDSDFGPITDTTDQAPDTSTSAACSS